MASKTEVNAEAEAQPEAKPVKVRPPGIYQRLDGTAESRRASAVQALRRGLDVSEQVIMPLNPGGWQDPGRAHMLAEVATSNATKREQLREIESLTGDDLVIRFCQDCLAPQGPGYGGLTINGAPIGRGQVPSSFSPGMNQASV